MHPKGTHVILDCYECDSSLLDDKEYLERELVSAALMAGAEVREVTFHKFAPQGVSGVVIISESHLSIHTYPEYGYTAVDIFTCGDKIKVNFAVDYILFHLKSKRYELKTLERGDKV